MATTVMMRNHKPALSKGLHRVQSTTFFFSAVFRQFRGI